MFNMIFLVKNELYKNFYTKKNYLMDYLFGIIKKWIILIGFIYLGSNMDITNFQVDLDFLIQICVWFLLTNVVSNEILEIEKEIRLDYFKNMIHHKSSFVNIYFSRMIAIFIELICVFILPLILFFKVIGYTNIYNIKVIYGVIFLTIYLAITIFLSYFFLLLVLYLKRISAAYGIFTYYLLFFSGLVFSDSHFEKLKIFERLNKILFNGVNSYGLFKYACFISFLVFLIFLLRKLINKKIHFL